MFGQRRAAEYTREQAEHLEAAVRLEDWRATQQAAWERQNAERRAERERRAQEKADVLSGMTAGDHLDRAIRMYARGGDANAVVVEMLFAIAKGGAR